MTADSEAKYTRRPAKKAARRKVIAVVAVAAVVCAGVCAVGFGRYYAGRQHEKEVNSTLNTDRFYSGIVVQGVKLGGMTMQQAQQAVKAKEASAVGNYDVKITYGDKKWELTQKDMTFTYDTDSVLKKGYAYGRTGDRETRYKQVKALKTKPQEFSITAAVDENGLKTKVDTIAASVNRKPVEPTVVSFDRSSGAFTCKDGVAGLSVDTAKLWSDVKAVVGSKRTGTVPMQVKTVPFTKTVSDVKNNMKRLGSFSTTSTNTEAGTYNMKKALLAANGTCIPAGGTFSFFNTVGPCDQAHGYYQAGALFDGKLVQDYGGGICQASTTLYNAALRSGLEVVERYNHSVPSSYCRIGQDATVSYPDLDLKLKNTTDYPIYLATDASSRTLTATFYGYQPADYDDIEIVSQVDQTYAAPTTPKYTEDSSLSAGVVQLNQRARQGYKASARRNYCKNGKVVRTEYLNSSYYPPVAASYSYGKGTDLSRVQGASSPSSKKASSAASKPSSKPSSASSSEKTTG